MIPTKVTYGDGLLVNVNLPRNFFSLIALIGFGVVLAGSGFQGMESNSTVAFLGVAIIFADMTLWIIQKLSLRRNNQYSKKGKQAEKEICKSPRQRQ